MIVQLIVFHVVWVEFQNKLSLRINGSRGKATEVRKEKRTDQRVWMNSSIRPRAVLRSLRETA